MDKNALSSIFSALQDQDADLSTLLATMLSCDEKKKERKDSSSSKNTGTTTKQENPTRLEKRLNMHAVSNSHVAEGNYDEAYGILYTQIQLGEEANFAPVLINYYKVLTSTGRFNQAERAKEKLIEILRDHLRATPKECELLADKYRKQLEYIKANLFYQAGEALFSQDDVETDELINCLQGCALGLKISTTKLVKLRPDLRVIVTKEIVPGIRRVYNKLRNMSVGRERKMILVQSLCLHHIETTELEAEDPSIREATLREAVEMMETNLGEDVWKYHLYSAHLNNLAVACMSLERPEEAIGFFHKAIKARNSATDYDTTLEKEQDLSASQNGLGKAEEMMRFMQQEQLQQQQQQQIN